MNQRISTAAGFRVIAIAVIALMLIFPPFQTDRWNWPTIREYLIFYPPLIVLLIALCNPIRFRFILRIFAGLVCGGVLLGASLKLLISGPDAHAAAGNETLKIAKAVMFIPLLAA